MNKWFQTLRVISRTVGCVVVLLLMYLTLLPVERRWAGAEILVADWTGVLLLTGAVMLLAVAGKMKITVTDVVVFAWFAVYTVMVWTGDTYSCQSEFLHATVMFLLYFALRQMFVVAGMPAWMIIASVIVGGCYEAVMGMEQMVNGTSRHMQYLLTGNFLNPGPYSAYLMMGLAVGLSASVSSLKELRLSAHANIMIVSNEHINVFVNLLFISVLSSFIEFADAKIRNIIYNRKAKHQMCLCFHSHVCENPFKKWSLITKTANSWAKIVAFLLLKAYFFEAYFRV